MTRQVFAWGAVAFLIFFIAFNPGAADVFRSIGAAFMPLVDGLQDFFGNLVR